MLSSSAAAAVEDVADSDCEEAADDKEDSDPLVAEESLLQRINMSS